MTADTSHSLEPDLTVLKSLADTTRLRLLRLLYREEVNVQELADILEMGQPRVSRHLAVLRNAGLVRDRREGTKVYYRLAEPEGALASFASYLEGLGRSQHPDLERLEECLRSRTRQARSFADDKATQWDEIRRLLHSSSAALLALAKMVPPLDAVADLGTGTGLMLPFLAAMAEHVWAVDQSPRMLDQARERCNRLSIGNVTFVQSSIEDTHGRIPPCNAVILHFVLHQVARPNALLQTARELLQPGGHVVVVDRVQHQDEKAKTTFGSLWLGFAEQQLAQWMDEANLKGFYWHKLQKTDRSTDNELDLFVAAAAREALA